MSDKPKMTLGQRFRVEPGSAVVAPILVALVPAAIIAALVLAMTNSSYREWNFPPAIITFVIAMVCAVPAMILINHLVENEEVDGREKKLREEFAKRERQTAEFNELKAALRLPLLEWAVEQGVVDKIEHLDSELAIAVREYGYRNDWFPRPTV